LIHDLSRLYLQSIANYVGIQGDVPARQLSLWNLDHVHTLSAAFQSFDLKALSNLKSLLSKSLQFRIGGRDPVDKFNAATEAIFKTHQLDVSKWLTYSKQQWVTLSDGRQLTLQLWNRRPPEDLFQGTYAQSCVAMDGGNGVAMVDALNHIVVQMLEIKEAYSHKNIGKVLMFWAKEGKNGQPFLVADNVQLKTQYRNHPEIRDAIATYMAQLGQDVAGKPVHVLMGTKYTKICDEQLPIAPLGSLQVLGKTETNRFFLNALLTGPVAQWPKLSQLHTVNLALLARKDA
jgi:hypothetical protein